MKVKLLINLGRADAGFAELDMDEAQAGKVVDVKDATGEALIAKGWATDETDETAAKPEDLKAVPPSGLAHVRVNEPSLASEAKAVEVRKDAEKADRDAPKVPAKPSASTSPGPTSTPGAPTKP